MASSSSSETLHRVTELLAQHAQLLERLVNKIDTLTELQHGENAVLATLKHEVADKVREDISREMRELASAFAAVKQAAQAIEENEGKERRGERGDVTGKHKLVVGAEGMAVSYSLVRRALPWLVSAGAAAAGWIGHHLLTRGGH